MEEKIGVLLLNLGGPETLKDVQPFLYNLFADPDIIRLPGLFKLLQRALAKLISVLRARKSKEGQMLLRMALEAKNVNVSVYVGMRYWYPFTEEAIEQVMIFFSAHGVPVSYVEDAGDPYKDQMEECVYLITQELKSREIGNDHTLAYQSRVGPVQWLKPYTDEVLVELGQKGVKSLLAVPGKILTLESGIENWGHVPALGCTSSFITDLADAVVEALPSAKALSASREAAEETNYEPVRYLVKLFFCSILAFVLLLLRPKVVFAFRNHLRY
ncbi:Ferrochelatase [Gossypium australe]|uniref:Ferrochelatase n=1 Tax=Gossypium australe TaxID=47621 RepID=A0A5B6W9F6_9ROSI|nr:Ferrochelatase [Gossypium australe]